MKAEGLDIRQQSPVARCLQLAIPDRTSRTDQISAQGLILTSRRIAKPRVGSACNCLASCTVLEVRRLNNSTLTSSQNLFASQPLLRLIALTSALGVQWHYDDEKVPVPLTGSGLDHLSTNMYVLFAKRSQVVVASAASHTEPTARHDEHQLCGSRSDIPHIGGSELGGQPDVPAESSDRSSGNGIGDHSADSFDALHSGHHS